MGEDEVRALTGTPSLQRASGRMWYVSVNGGFVVNSTRETRSGLKRAVGTELERAWQDP